MSLIVLISGIQRNIRRTSQTEKRMHCKYKNNLYSYLINSLYSWRSCRWLDILLNWSYSLLEVVLTKTFTKYYLATLEKSLEFNTLFVLISGIHHRSDAKKYQKSTGHSQIEKRINCKYNNVTISILIDLLNSWTQPFC